MRLSNKLAKVKSLNEKDLAIIYLLPEKYLHEFLKDLCEDYGRYKSVMELARAFGIDDDQHYENCGIIKQNITDVIRKIVNHVENNKQDYPKIYADIQEAKYGSFM